MISLNEFEKYVKREIQTDAPFCIIDPQHALTIIRVAKAANKFVNEQEPAGQDFLSELEEALKEISP